MCLSADDSWQFRLIAAQTEWTDDVGSSLSAGHAVAKFGLVPKLNFTVVLPLSSRIFFSRNSETYLEIRIGM